MQSLRNLALAGAAALAFAPAAVLGADLPAPVYKAPIIEEFGGWYLRGDIGMSNQQVKKLDSPAFDASVVVLAKGFDSAPIFGVGIGYQYNSWLRFDLTSEWRGGATFRGLDTFDNGGTPNSNDYHGTKTEWLTLFNGYLDLGTWNSITPYVGAGVGFSRNTISNWRDLNINAPGGAVAFANSKSQWDFAWALHAGISYKVAPNFLVDLSYRYVHLGDASSDDMIGFDGSNGTFNPIRLKGISSNDFRLGVRWMFADNFYPSYDPPLVRKY